jgi:hypothetical protein
MLVRQLMQVSITSSTPALWMGSKMDSLDVEAELQIKLPWSIFEWRKPWYNQSTTLFLSPLLMNPIKPLK